MKMIQENNDIYKEVLTVLAYFDNSLIEKIPGKVLKNLNELAADSEANFYIDPEKDLEKQDISEESKDLIALIYYDFIADENEKKEMMKSWNDNEKIYQEKLRKKYDIDNIFENRRKETSKFENTSIDNTLMIEYKKGTIFHKIKNFIKNILKATK